MLHSHLLMSEIIPATTSGSTAAHTSQASTTIPTNMTSSSLKSAPAPCPSTTFTETELIILCGKRKWKEASERAKYVPSEAYISCQPYGSALALCCRYGAPQETIQDVLHACPEQIRYSAGEYLLVSLDALIISRQIYHCGCLPSICKATFNC